MAPTPGLNPMGFYLWGHLNTPVYVYACLTGNEEAPHHRMVDACQAIRELPHYL
jgi:hypothetical protein